MQTSDGLFFIEPMKTNNSDESSRPHLIYQTKDLPKKLFTSDNAARESLSQPLQGIYFSL